MSPLYATEDMRSRIVIQLLASNECDPLVSVKPGSELGFGLLLPIATESCIVCSSC
jgi:hypothetical protein